MAAQQERSFNLYSHLIVKKVYRWLLAFIFSVIVISAHYDNYVLWRILVTLGIDISMTPLTVDMMYMSESRISPRKYEDEYSIFWKSNDDEGVFAMNDLDFYEFKIPLHLMMELVLNNVRVDGHVDAVCRSLKRKTGKTITFWKIQGQKNMAKDWSC